MLSTLRGIAAFFRLHRYWLWNGKKNNIKMGNKHFLGIWFCSLMNMWFICASIDLNKNPFLFISGRIWSNRRNIAMWDERLAAKKHSKHSYKRSSALIRPIHSWSDPIWMRLLWKYKSYNSGPAVQRQHNKTIHRFASNSCSYTYTAHIARWSLIVSQAKCNFK